MTENYKNEIIRNQSNRPLADKDIFFDFEQKGVDMRIGIDIASLTIKRLVDRVILFSGDTDMIPAIKLARTEGIQVFAVKVGNWQIPLDIYEHCDGLRELTK